MEHQPLFNWVFCQKIDPPAKTGTGIVVPTKAKDNFPYAFAKVKAVGPGIWAKDGNRQPMTVKPGNVITYPKSRGELLPVDPNDPLNTECILILNETEILSIVKDFPEQTSITSLDGRFLTMEPSSTALPDQVYKTRDDVAVAKHYGVIAKNDRRYVDEYPPGQGPDDAGESK